jgi:epoxyqueuosine reductase
LSYFIEKGGIYLKDTAVLAGLGCIGKNNILVTPELGPKVRLRALLLEEDLTPTGPIDFDPCDGCEEFCRKACPQNAFEKIVISSAETGLASLPGRSGCYSRSTCLIQSSKSSNDDEDSRIDENKMLDLSVDLEDIDKTKNYFETCRLCDLACPVGS